MFFNEADMFVHCQDGTERGKQGHSWILAMAAEKLSCLSRKFLWVFLFWFGLNVVGSF